MLTVRALEDELDRLGIDRTRVKRKADLEELLASGGGGGGGGGGTPGRRFATSARPPARTRIASLTPVATWPEFAARYPAVGKVPPLDAIRVAPKHAVLVPDFVEQRRVRSNWLDLRTAEQRAALGAAIADERKLALGAVDDRVHDGALDPAAEWRPVGGWDAFGARYPDLAGAVKSVRNATSYETARRELPNNSGPVYARLESSALAWGDFALLVAALRNETSLAEWLEDDPGRDGTPWSPRALPLVQARIRAELPDTPYRDIVSETTESLDTAVRAFWYYYMTALDRDRRPPLHDHLDRKATSLSSSGRGGGDGGGGGGNGGGSSRGGGGGAAVETKEERRLVAEVERRRAEEAAAERELVAARERLRAEERARDDHDERTRLEIGRRRATEHAAERARVAAEDELRRVEGEHRRATDVGRMIAEIQRLFPDQADQVKRVLRL